MSRTGGSIRNILRNTGWQLVGKVVSAVLSMLYLAIVTRSLGTDGFGKFSLVLAAGQAIELLVTFQSWQIVVRYGMQHLHSGNRSALAALLRFTTWLDVAGALISVVLVTLLIAFFGIHFGWDSTFVHQATLCCVILVLSTHWTPIGVLLLHDRFATAAIADAMTPITRFVGAVSVWLIHPSVIGFLAVWAIAELVTALAYWWSALRLRGLSWRLDARLRWRGVAADNPGIGHYAMTTNLKSSLDVGGKQIAMLLVGLLVTPAALGGFRLAQQLAQTLVTVSQLVSRAIFPELMRSRTNASWVTDFDALLARTVRLTAIGGAVVVAILLLFGRAVLGLIGGPAFLAAFPVLLLLGTAAAVEFAAVAFEPAVVALGRPGAALKLRAISTTFLLAAIAALTPLLGTNGAGAAVLAASIVSIILLGLTLRRLLRRNRLAESGGAAFRDTAPDGT